MTSGRHSRLFGGSPNKLLVDENVPGIVLPDIAPEAMPALEAEEDENELLLAGSAEDDIDQPQSEEEARYQDYVQSGGGLRLFIGNPTAGDIEERVRLPDDVDGPVWDVSSLAAPPQDEDVEVYEHGADEVAEAQARFTPVLRIGGDDDDVLDAPTPPGFEMSFGGAADAAAEASEDASDPPSANQDLETDGFAAAPSVPPGRISVGDTRLARPGDSGAAVDSSLYDAVLDVGYGDDDASQERRATSSEDDFENVQRDPFGDGVGATHQGGTRDIWSTSDDLESGPGSDLADASGDAALDDAETLPPFDTPDYDAMAQAEDSGGLLQDKAGTPTDSATSPLGSSDDAVFERVTDPDVRSKPFRRLVPWLALLFVILLAFVALVWAAMRVAPPPETGPPGAEASQAVEQPPGVIAPSEPPVDPDPAVGSVEDLATADVAEAVEPPEEPTAASAPVVATASPKPSSSPALTNTSPSRTSKRSSPSRTSSSRASSSRPASTSAGARIVTAAQPSAEPEAPTAAAAWGATAVSPVGQRAPEVTVTDIPIGEVLLGTSIRVEENQSVISVTSNADAVVFVDGMEIGSSPIARHTLTAGKHVIKAVSPASRKVTEVALDVSPGAAKGIAFQF